MILKIERLTSKMATGHVIKMYFSPEPHEVEHSLLIVMDGSVLLHTHPDKDGISEGYREYSLQSRSYSDWEVVGAGMPTKSHGVPFAKGLRIIEGSKREGGIESWPELLSTK